jgi:myo-inositol-1(or 4)-monophosphatase
MNEFRKNPETNWEKFSPEIKTAVQAVLQAANESIDLRAELTDADVQVKTGQSHGLELAYELPGDRRSEEIIYEILSKKFPGARFLMEEKMKNGDPDKIITSKKLYLIKDGLVFIVDPLDGTSQYKQNKTEWSHSIAKMENFELTGGVIYAPRVGLLAAGEAGFGVEIKDDQPNTVFKPILFGVDLNNLPPKDQDPDGLFRFEPLMSELKSDKPDKIQPIGSCALGLALVAAGKSETIIQPNQFGWDYSAGLALNKLKNHTVILYNYRGGKITRMPKLDQTSFDPDKRQTGFIVSSNETEAEKYFEKIAA